MKNNKFSKLGFVIIALGSFAISLSSCSSASTKGDDIKAFFSGTGGKVELNKDAKDLKLNDIVKINISKDNGKYLKTLTLNGFDISMNLSAEAYTKELIFEFKNFPKYINEAQNLIINDNTFKAFGIITKVFYSDEELYGKKEIKK